MLTTILLVIFCSMLIALRIIWRNTGATARTSFMEALNDNLETLLALLALFLFPLTLALVALMIKTSWGYLLPGFLVWGFLITLYWSRAVAPR